MSDYFSRLADRALGRAEVLAPRVPYRFEAGAPAVSAAPPDDSGEEPSSDLENSSPLSKPIIEISPPARVNRPSVPTLPGLQEPTRNGLGRTSAAAPQAGSPAATHEPQRRQRPPAPVTAPRADNPSEPKPQSVLRPPPTQRNERRDQSRYSAKGEGADEPPRGGPPADRIAPGQNRQAPGRIYFARARTAIGAETGKTTGPFGAKGPACFPR